MEEIWRDVIGYEGRYYVSNLGNVKSVLYRKLTDDYKIKILTPKRNWDGYLRIQLWRNQKAKFVAIHRLVAESFIVNEDDKPFVNHINGIKDDNRVGNLEWVTQKENIIHAWGTGLAKQRLNSKLSKAVDQFDLEGNYIETFPSTMEVERKLGINHVNISYACKEGGMKRTSGGYKWRYVEVMSNEK